MFLALISGLTGASVFASGLTVLPGAIRDFSMSTCKKGEKICVTVVAENAEGASLKRLFALEGPKVTIVDMKTGQNVNAVWPKGYVDLDLNRLVVWRQEGSRRIEKVYDF
jgi:hypothetical protein